MPQFELGTVFWPQIVWLAAFFAILYFAIVGPTLPKLNKVVAAREEAVTSDIAAAEAAKAEADRIAAAREAKVDAARDRARGVVSDAKAGAARNIESRLAEAGRGLEARQAEATASLMAARDRALAEIEQVSADLAIDIVEHLTGMRPDLGAARAAVAGR